MLDIEAIKKRAEAATPGPWYYGIDSCDCGEGYGCSHRSWAYEVRCVKPEPDPSWGEVEKIGRKTSSGHYQHPIIEDMCCNIDDAEFFTHARTDIPALLDELERTRAAAKELREAYKYLVKHSSPILNLNLDGCEDGAPKLYSYSANCRTFIQHLLKETKWLEDLG